MRLGPRGRPLCGSTSFPRQAVGPRRQHDDHHPAQTGSSPCTTESSRSPCRPELEALGQWLPPTQQRRVLSCESHNAILCSRRTNGAPAAQDVLRARTHGRQEAGSREEDTPGAGGPAGPRTLSLCDPRVLPSNGTISTFPRAFICSLCCYDFT